jgi:protein TonB
VSPAPRAAGGHQLAAALLLSAALHGLVLGWWPPRAPAPVPSAGALQVELTAGAAPAPLSEPARGPAPAASKGDTAAPAPTAAPLAPPPAPERSRHARSRPARAAPAGQAPVPAAPAGGEAAAPASALAAPAELARLLHQAIAERRRYPLVARRQGWEGRATVRFELLPDGAVRACAVSSSSGYPALDRAALAAVEEIQPFAPARGRLAAARTFQVEVEFRLR